MKADFFNFANEFEIEHSIYRLSSQMSSFHYHNCYELYILEEGNRNILIGEDIFQVSPQDVVLIKPNLLHKSIGGSYSRTLLYFTDSFLQNYYKEQAISTLLSCFSHNIISLTKDAFTQLKSLINKIRPGDVNKPDNTVFIYLADILLLLNDNLNYSQIKSSDDTSPNANAKISPILAYINKNYNKLENISQISNEFHVTKCHLCRIFKKSTGLTVTQYLNGVKVQKACSLLTTTSNSITDIGFICGFNSTMYFCKTFKEIMKVTPSDYRKQYR
jgi:AraC-like DNA-binding protein